MNKYDNLSKEDLIRLLEFRDSKKSEKEQVILPVQKSIRKVISNVLTLLFNSDDKNAINNALSTLIKFLDVDWGYVAYFEKGHKTVNFLYEVTSPWVNNSKEDVSILSYETIPWMIDTVITKKDIILSDINDLPAEAHIDKLLLEKQELKSMLVIPLTFHEKVQGFIGFDSVRIQRYWTLMEVEDLHLIASIFSIIIERQQTQLNIKKSRALLMQSNSKFKMFFENLPLGVELYDRDGYLVDINEADLQLFGVKKEDSIGLNLFNNPNLPPHIISDIRSGVNTSFPLEYKFDIVQKTNYYHTVVTTQTKYLQVKGLALTKEEQGLIGYLFIISDNTENHIKTELTKSSLAKLKAVLLNGQSIIGEYDVEEDKFIFDPSLNIHLEDSNSFSYLKKIKNLTLAKVKDSILPEDILRSDFSQFKKLLDGIIDNCCVTYRKITPDNKIIWLRITARTYKTDKNNKPSRIICYIINITDEKILEAKLHAAEDESRRSETEMQKAREADMLKSAFLANMSHEIRTPLNAIVGFSSIIAETDLPDERKIYLDIINKNSEMLLRLITDILDFSKIESGKLEYQIELASLKNICNESYIAQSLKTQAGVNLFYFPDKLPDIILYTDAKRITQVISNLLSNAIKFTPAGSITLSYEKIENEVCIWVKDTGIGIASEKQNDIFNRFVKVNEFEQGTGLGLAICKNIVQSLNGTIGLDSEPGKGSTFWFKLPIKPSDEKQIPYDNKISRTPSATQKAEQKRHTILIAEDVEENFYLLEVIFKKQYNLIHANNGVEAVELYNKHLPDIILMDIKMPLMNGFEAGCEIRKKSSTVPIIALTAFAFEKDRQMAKECKFNDYLTKPINITLLKEIINRYLK